MKKAKKATIENTESVANEKPTAAGAPTAPPTSFSRLHLILAFGGVAIFLAIYLLRLDKAAALLQDDGWYILLAKALASGQGYTLINSPTPGIPPLYPPGFPVLLSLVFRIAPQFPENVYLLKSVSILAMFGVGVATAWYFARHRELAWGLAIGIATVTVLAPPFVFFATSTLMSECVFSLLQLLTIVVVERSLRLMGKRQLYYLVLGVGLTTAAVLTRSVAVSLVLAILLYLLKERQKVAILSFSVGLLLLLGPWMLYTRTHTPTPAQRAEQRGYIVIPYLEQLWHKLAGDEHSGKESISDLPLRVWGTTTKIMGRQVGVLTLSPLYSLTGSSEGGILSFLLSLFAIIGYVAVCRERLTLVELLVPLSLAVTLLWPFDPLRFVLPLAPFLIFYLLYGVKTSYDFFQQKLGETELRSSWHLFGITVSLFLVLHVYEHATYIGAKYQADAATRPFFLRMFEENREMVIWVKENTQPDAIIAAENPPFVYLYADRKTVQQGDVRADWEQYEKVGVRYWARTGMGLVGPITANERQYRIVYPPKGQLGVRVIDLGTPGQRKAWGQ